MNTVPWGVADSRDHGVNDIARISVDERVKQNSSSSLAAIDRHQRFNYMETGSSWRIRASDRHWWEGRWNTIGGRNVYEQIREVTTNTSWVGIPVLHTASRHTIVSVSRSMACPYQRTTYGRTQFELFGKLE